MAKNLKVTAKRSAAETDCLIVVSCRVIIGVNLSSSNENDSFDILKKFVYDVWSFAFKCDRSFAYAPKSDLKKHVNNYVYNV